MFYYKSLLIKLLIISFGLCTIAALSDQLKDFHKAFNEAKQELQGIRSIMGNHDEKLLRQRRRTIDDLLANFQREVDIADELENGDNWYRQLRAKETKNSNSFKSWDSAEKKKKKKADINDIFNDFEKSNRKSYNIDYTDNIDYLLASPFEAKHQDSREINMNLYNGITNPLNNFDIEKDVESNFGAKKKDKKDSAPDDDEVEANDPYSYERTIENIHFPSIVSETYEPQKIDYSHEANYKLSKVEQDAAERKKENKMNWKNTYAMKRSSFSSTNAFNPMNEIKLKTSHRLMRKGYGPSLPSNGLTENKHEVYIDDLVKRLEKVIDKSDKTKESDKKQKNYDVFDELETLMSVDNNRHNANIRNKRLNEVVGQANVVPLQSQATNDMQSCSSSSSSAGSGSTYVTRPKRVETVQTKASVQNSNADTSSNLNANINMNENSNLKSNINSNIQLNANVAQTNSEQNNMQNSQNSRLTPDAGMESLTGEAKKQPEMDIGEQKQKRCSASTSSSSNLKTSAKSALAEETASQLENDKRRFKRIGGEKQYRSTNIANQNAVDDTAALKFDRAKGKREENFGDAWKIMTLDGLGSYKRPILKRSKRYVPSEDELLEQNDDFDSYETNADAGHLRTKRILMANVAVADVVNTTTTASVEVAAASTETVKYALENMQNSADFGQIATAHKRRKREATGGFDEVEDNNSDTHKYSEQLAEFRNSGMRREDNYEEDAQRKLQRERQKRKKKPYDFSDTAREFEDEQFDNLKQKDMNAAKFDDSKFDNLWYGNKANSKDENMRKDSKDESNYRTIADENKYEHMNNAKNVNDNEDNNNINNNSNNSNNINNINNNNNNNINNNNNNNNANSDVNKYVSGGNQNNAEEGKRSNLEIENKPQDKNFVLSLGDQILNCTSFASLEKFLSSIKKSNDSNPTKSDARADENTNTMSGKENKNSDSKADANAPKEEVINIGVLGVPTDTSSPSTASNHISGNNNKKDMMKLNIRINASVIGDQRAKNFFGNGTINVEPGKLDDRNRRDTRRINNKRVSGQCAADKEEDNPLESMLNGKVSTQVVKSVFSMVRSNPKLKVLWPSLKRNRFIKKQMENLYPIRNQDNEMEVQKTERLLKKVMETINGIVDQEVRAHTCVALRPDLVDFYEMILRTTKENEKSRDKRDNSVDYDADFAQQIRALDPNKIEEKSRIVKKLLKQYEELPREDQEQVIALRDDLLSNLLSLHKLKVDQDVLLERRKRDAIDHQQISVGQNEMDLLKELEAEYSPAFLKLLKTSELFREASEQEQI